MFLLRLTILLFGEVPDGTVVTNVPVATDHFAVW
jgi:hypothetical protein